MHKFLFHSKFIIFLYMFGTLLYSSSGDARSAKHKKKTHKFNIVSFLCNYIKHTLLNTKLLRKAFIY